METEKYILITGANRGIGLELTKQLLFKSQKVIAAVRSPETATELMKLQDQHKDDLILTQFDALNPNGANELSERLSESVGHIDWLINNAGIFKHAVLKHHDDEASDFGKFTWTALSEMMSVNTVTPIMTCQELHPLLEKSPAGKVFNISSEMGSIAQNDYHENMGYCVSKAALNMSTRKLAQFYAKDGIPVVAVSPGWVRTDMGGPNADLSVEESAQALIEFFNKVGTSHSGKFFRRDGTEVPW